MSGWRHYNSTSLVQRLQLAISHKNGVHLISPEFGWIQKLQSRRKQFLLAADLHHARPLFPYSLSLLVTGQRWLVTLDSAYPFHHILHQAMSRLCSQLSVPVMRKILAMPWLLTLAWMATSAILSSIHLGKEGSCLVSLHSAFSRLVPSLNYDWQNLVSTNRGFGNRNQF